MSNICDLIGEKKEKKKKEEKKNFFFSPLALYAFSLRIRHHRYSFPCVSVHSYADKSYYFGAIFLFRLAKRLTRVRSKLRSEV